MGSPGLTLGHMQHHVLIIGIMQNPTTKVIKPKYSKHQLYTVAHTIDCVCSKMLNHGLFFTVSHLIYADTEHF